jgi:hypothetical protein
MIRPKPKGILTRKLAERTLGGRARLYHWLRLNYDELAAAKSELRFTWSDLAMTVAEAGALDAAGMPPKAEAVRKAWIKLETDMKAAGKKTPAPAPSASAIKSRPTTSPVIQAAADEEISDEPPARHTFVPAKLR